MPALESNEAHPHKLKVGRTSSSLVYHKNHTCNQTFRHPRLQASTPQSFPVSNR